MSRLVNMQRRYGSEWYLENDEGHVSWLAPMVKEHIERLEDENTKLRKELELAGHIAVSNVVASIGREESLEAENDKLRKVCADAWMLLVLSGNDDLVAELTVGKEKRVYDAEEIANCMKELGIEAGE